MGRKPYTPPPPPEEIPEKEDVVVMEVRLKSGRFISSVSVPLFASMEEKKRAADRWLRLMQTCFELGIDSADVSFDEKKA